MLIHDYVNVPGFLYNILIRKLLICIDNLFGFVVVIFPTVTKFVKLCLTSKYRHTLAVNKKAKRGNI